MNRISSLFNFIANKIGNVSMGTTATTITGAIAEHEGDITSIKNNPDIKWYRFSVYSDGESSRSWPPGATTVTVNVPRTPSGYTSWVFGVRSTSRFVTYTWTNTSGSVTIHVYNSNSSAVTCYVNGFAVFLKNSNQLSL